jgi:aminoglycoside phosphotransferase (APT) family kinase protein
MPGGSTAPGAAALALVPGLEGGGAPMRLERLEGGTVNDSWRVDSAIGRFVLRIDGPEWRRPGVDRERERHLHDVATSGGLAPRVLRRDQTVGAQVSEFLAGRTWIASDLAHPASLARLVARLSQLHALRPPAGIEAFDPAAIARDYLQRIGPAVRASSGADGVAARVAAAARRVGADERGPGVVHGDLAPANLLDGTTLWFIDWEYAQVADPVYDLGCLLAYHPELRPRARWLLDAAGLGAAGDAERLAAAIEVYESLSWLWQRARDDPPTGVRGGRSAN